MKDVLIPLGLLLFIGFFVYAIIHTARKQRKAKARVFRDFADKNGLSYQEEDDGKVQCFAKDFDGIGRFSDPSLGKVIPKDVVDGITNGMEAILFRHSIRISEGWAREWFVAGVTSDETVAERCAVQFCKGKADKSTMHLQDPVVKEQKVGSFNLVVRAANPSCAGKIVDNSVLKQLASLAGNLSFRPEIQVRGKRIVAYLADRNATVDDVEILGDLFEFTKSAAC
ncbi:MAG: hypothetical protein GY774_24835, partial [Planctomycetes bacterium]|nr:hypothetical protein [Planctomycetota bacterium]